MPLADTSSVHPNPLIAPGDGMLFEDRREEYFAIGRRALELIQFSGTLCDKPHYPRILDLPCGHGRVLRWLRAHYHYAQITACDLDTGGVAFCAQTFAATPVVSQPDLSRVQFPEPFDLIWCGSLLTHLPPETWPSVLDSLERWTSECGVIVLSLQGRFYASLLARGRTDIAENIDKAALAREFAQRGVSFQRYFETPQEPYGVTVSTPEVVGRWLQSRPNLIVRAYMEQAWGIQDVVVLYKKAGYFEPLPPRAFP